MGNTNNKEAQEVQEVILTQEETGRYALQIILRFFNGVNYAGFGITEETAATIEKAIKAKETPEAGIVTPGDPAFNTGIYLAAVMDEEAIPAAIKEVLTMAQDQAGHEYEKEAVLGTLFYVLTALEVEVATVNALTTPGTLEEKDAEAARRFLGKDPKKRNEAIEARAERLREAFKKDHPEFFSPEADKEKSIPRYFVKAIEKLEYPLDKPNSALWNMIKAADASGQFTFGINTLNRKTADPDILLSIDFHELEKNPDLHISRELTSFDKRCFIAAAALLTNGETVTTVRRIYQLMGNKGRPGPKDTEKINDSLTKMTYARLTIDNLTEAKNSEYERFKYSGPIMPVERVDAFINGALTESAIHFLREDAPPPLLDFAKKRGQVTTIRRELLESPVSKTEDNLRLDDYLIERIGHMKGPNSKGSKRLLYETIYKNCGITTPKKKQRAKGYIERYLTHYKATGWITDFTLGKDGITITL